MDYQEAISTAQADPQSLENIYRQSVNQGEEAAFKSALFARYQEMPENLLFAAWYYRLLRKRP